MSIDLGSDCREKLADALKNGIKRQILRERYNISSGEAKSQ